MKILYLAHGIPVPGHLGGSTHTVEVARGLARRGHSVHLVAARRTGWRGVVPFVRLEASTHPDFCLYYQDIPKQVGLFGAVPVLRLAQKLRPDVMMERYYNFSGAGVWAAHRLGIPCLLEINALVVDPPEVFKRRLDDGIGGPMRRWAVAQCRWAQTLVTPLHTTVPAEIPREKIVELPWGADVERFAPPAVSGADMRKEGPRTALFLGSFRAWHGVLDFVRAALLLLERGCRYHFTLVGDGPERAHAEHLAAAFAEHFRFTGAIPYEQVPGEVHRATVGVAPFTTTPHPALRAAGFFWSPLKVYEYMAGGVPVVTTNLHPLNRIIRDGQEGVLFCENDCGDLARAIGQVMDDPVGAGAMGVRARARVVEHFSWQRHCAELERLLLAVKEKVPGV